MTREEIEKRIYDYFEGYKGPEFDTYMEIAIAIHDAALEQVKTGINHTEFFLSDEETLRHVQRYVDSLKIGE